MASYKKPCLHCGCYIEADSRFCPSCASDSPFGYQCPACRRPADKTQAVCAGCGRPLYIACPICGERTFVQSRCERCGNPRCGAWQFFENTKCTACGKKLRYGENGR